MIAAKLHQPDGSECILLVLEPGNLEKLKSGQPIHKWLNEFMPELPHKVELLFAYSPDVPWVAEQMQKIHDKDAIKLAQIIEESLTRPEVLIRDHTAEEMKRVF